MDLQEPQYTVINDALIKKCIFVKKKSESSESKAAFDEAPKVKEKQLEFHEVETLIFSFKRISVISSLVGFDALKKLQLDNNNIKKIENLGELNNLTHLGTS